MLHQLPTRDRERISFGQGLCSIVPAPRGREHSKVCQGLCSIVPSLRGREHSKKRQGLCGIVPSPRGREHSKVCQGLCSIVPSPRGREHSKKRQGLCGFGREMQQVPALRGRERSLQSRSIVPAPRGREMQQVPALRGRERSLQARSIVPALRGREMQQDRASTRPSGSRTLPSRFFKAIPLLDTKVFEARAMLATKVKVVILPSMLSYDQSQGRQSSSCVATKASKARAGLKFLVYNEATCSFVFDTKAMLATEASRLECHHRLQG